MDWVRQNLQLLTLVVNTLMLVVWVAYLQLFWRGYRRRIRADIIISRGAGSSLDALCLVSNMSGDAVFVEGVVAFVEAEGQLWSCAVTELTERAGGDGRSPREGPLKSNDYMDVGSFKDLVELAVDGPRTASESRPICPKTIEVWVVAHYSSDNDVIFSKRRFLVKKRGGFCVPIAEGLETRRVKSRREREHVENVLRKHLEGAGAGGYR